MKKWSLFSLIVLMLSVFAIALSANGAHAALYLKLDGIDGEVTEEGHRDWIDIYSVSWGVTMTAGYASGGGGASGRPDFSDLSWNQSLDMSVPKLFDAISRGKNIRDAKVDFTFRHDAKEEIYFQMEFQDVLLTNLFLSSGSEGRASLAGSFAYGKISMKYFKFDGSGKPGGYEEAEYDLRTMEGTLAGLAGVYALGMNGPQLNVVPLPAALWLFGSGVAALIGMRRKTKG